MKLVNRIICSNDGKFITPSIYNDKESNYSKLLEVTSGTEFYNFVKSGTEFYSVNEVSYPFLVNTIIWYLDKDEPIYDTNSTTIFRKYNISENGGLVLLINNAGFTTVFLNKSALDRFSNGYKFRD